jgi:hypothetical protein
MAGPMTSYTNTYTNNISEVKIIYETEIWSVKYKKYECMCIIIGEETELGT